MGCADIDFCMVEDACQLLETHKEDIQETSEGTE